MNFNGYIDAYLRTPEALNKIGSLYPNAGSGILAVNSTGSTKEAVYKIARASYIKRKENALIRAGLTNLEELDNV